MDYSTQIRQSIDNILKMGWVVKIIRISEKVNEDIIIRAYLQNSPAEGLNVSEKEAYKIIRKKIAGKKLMQLFGYPVEVSRGLINWTFSVDQENYNTL